MADDSELAMWAEIASSLIRDVEAQNLVHSEASIRADISIDQQQTFLNLLVRATEGATSTMLAAQRECNCAVSELGKWSTMMSSAKRESDQAAAIEVADLEASARALRAEVASLSTLRDQMRQDVATSTAALREQQTRTMEAVEKVDETTPNRLASLKSVRARLEGIRESNTPTHAPTSGEHWRARLLKLQGDLRTLRSELSTSPYRGD